MTSPQAEQLSRVLEVLPSRLQRKDLRARKAARVALEALNTGSTPAQALEALSRFLERLPDTPAAPVRFLPKNAQERPERPL